jgi:hypothetical protein
MKYKVIKEYAGIEVDSEVKLSESNAKYLIEQGYVELIDESNTPPSQPEAPAQNKAIEPKYKKNRNAAKTRNSRS